MDNQGECLGLDLFGFDKYFNKLKVIPFFEECQILLKVAYLKNWFATKQIKRSCIGLNLDTKVSVIIPTYRRPVMLRRAIESVLSQTYKNIEVIIVDDNNPGTKARSQTEEIMDHYKNNKEVRYIKHEKNKNGAAARNTGIKKSSGGVICFLDDDDYFLPEKIEKQLKYLQSQQQYHGIYCGRIQKGQYIKPEKSGDMTKEILSLTFTPTTCSLMFYKNVIEDIDGFNESFKRHQDFEFLLRFFQKYKLGFIEEALVVIGDNLGENAIHGKELESMKKNFFDTFSNIMSGLGRRERKEIYCSHYSKVFWNHINHGYIWLAIKLFLKYMIKYPFEFSKSNLTFVYRYLQNQKSQSNKGISYSKE